MIDLHTHTDASDGSLSLEELVRLAEQAGLKALAVTDHDTIQNARRLGSISSPLELIPGIEVSVYDDRLDYIDLHVIGLFIDPEDPKLLTTLKKLEMDREAQKRAIISKLNELGYDITYDDARRHAHGSVGRPHIARALMERYPEEFGSITEAFAKLLSEGRPAFLSRTAFFGLDDAIRMIHWAGGIAILAHPILYCQIRPTRYGLRKLLSDFKGLGGDGIETYYDYSSNYGHEGYTEEDNERLRVKLSLLASEMGLLGSGGSDFHGPNKGARLGAFPVPDRLLEEIKGHLKT
jgi:predicted metal-dependent phosphoesterase TrpH